MNATKIIKLMRQIIDDVEKAPESEQIQDLKDFIEILEKIIK